ncbi:hypothetical protein CBI38_07360 [Rhodococcus oxybenzonivorans]|uniref:Tetratricopeptide repeat protein n=1 Tax=Rhodococcus oxybenzonivorans TaxID=1990687 RepID=A0A2S2BS17_9NOCA|nr:hypothetical protein CBI38_07360 [Rhodococcus oxybenzonivorans]
MNRMENSDDVMAQIGRGQELAIAGDAEGARHLFAEVWGALEASPEGTRDPLHIVTLAHYMADVQTDPAEELRWDLRALEAADALTDDRAQRHDASLQVAAFYPSLHLNVAAAHLALGHVPEARFHLDRAAEESHHLAEDGYGNTIRGAIARLHHRIDEIAPVIPLGNSERCAEHR